MTETRPIRVMIVDDHAVVRSGLAAFLLVYAIHTRQQTDDKPGNQKWPLVTGIIIILFGLFILVTETAHIPAIRKIFRISWPIVLILIGLIVMFRPGRKE